MQIFRTAVIVAGFFLTGCSWFGQPEAYKTEGGTTVFRSAEPNPTDSVTPAPQKIPGESRH